MAKPQTGPRPLINPPGGSLRAAPGRGDKSIMKPDVSESKSPFLAWPDNKTRGTAGAEAGDLSFARGDVDLV